METLGDRIGRAGKLEAAEAVTLAARLAVWIEKLHAADDVHGAISPRAILLPSGEIRRAVLKSAHDAPAAHSYWSPEQLAGSEKRQADDVWALGAVLYLCLTGHAAFAGATPDKVAARIAGGGAAPLAVFDVGDDDLGNIVGALIAVDPESRLTLAFDVKTRLEAWLRRRGLAIGPPMEVLDDGPSINVDLASIPPPPRLPGTDDVVVPKAPRSPLQEFLDEDTTLPRDEPPPFRETRTRSGPPPLPSGPPPLPSGPPPLPSVPPPTPSRPPPMRQPSIPPMGSGPLADRIPPTSELLARAKAATSTPPPRLNPPKAARNSARPPPLAAPSPPLPISSPVPARAPRAVSGPEAAKPIGPLPKITTPPMKPKRSPDPVVPVEAPPSSNEPPSIAAAAEPEAVAEPARRSSLLDVVLESSPVASDAPKQRKSIAAVEAAKPKSSVRPEAPAAATASVRPPGSMRPSKAPGSLASAKARPNHRVYPVVGIAAGTVIAIYAGVRFVGSSENSSAHATSSASAAGLASAPIEPSGAASAPAVSAPPVASAPPPALSTSASAAPSAQPPIEDLPACFDNLLAANSIADGKHQDFAFVCKEVDPRKAASKVRSKVVFAAGGHVSDSMREWSMLGYYELATFAAMRGRCCPDARPLELPPSPGSCPSMQDALNTISRASHRGATEAEQSSALGGYRDALNCVAKSGEVGIFGDYPPLAGGQDAAFMKTFQRTRN